MLLACKPACGYPGASSKTENITLCSRPQNGPPPGAAHTMGASQSRWRLLCAGRAAGGLGDFDAGGARAGPPHAALRCVHGPPVHRRGVWRAGCACALRRHARQGLRRHAHERGPSGGAAHAAVESLFEVCSPSHERSYTAVQSRVVPAGRDEDVCTKQCSALP